MSNHDDILDRFAGTVDRSERLKTQAEPLRRQPYLGYNTGWRNITLAVGWSTAPSLDYYTPAVALAWRCVADQCVLRGRLISTSSDKRVLGTLPRDVVPPEKVTCWTSLIAADGSDAVWTHLYINTDGTISVKDIPSGSQQLCTFPCAWPLPVEGGVQ